jgi:prolyl oligopeptidase
MSAPIAYPAARRALQSYVKHRVTVPDPYHWMEDPKDAETQAFVKAQGATCEAYLDTYPHRAEIKEVISAMQDYPRTGSPGFRGDKVYYTHNTGLLNQARIMVAPADGSGAEAVFLDPNTFSEDQSSKLGACKWSKGNTRFAYSVMHKGGDTAVIKVRDGATGADLADEIKWVKFSGIQWFGDAGFFYTRFPPSEDGESCTSENPCIYFHTLGDAQEQDRKILDVPDHPKWLIGGELSDCQKYLVVSLYDGCSPDNAVWVMTLPDGFPAAGGAAPAVTSKLFDKWDAHYEFAGNDGASFYFETTKDAPLLRVVSVDIAAGSGAFTELVKEQDAKLDFCLLVGDAIVLVYLKDVKHAVYVRPLKAVDAAPVRLDVPIGTIVEMNARRTCSTVSFKMSSYLLPGRTFHFDIAAPTAITTFRDDKVAGLNPDEYEIKQVFYPSDDVMVPMFVCHKKGLALNANNPALLEGYGGFNISVTPAFNASKIVFMRNFNGVVAVANIRGGGEYGEKWHHGGKAKTKQNCYKDFIGAAEYLHDNCYTNPRKLAIMGGSNGGTLVAACANRAPHLFNAVVCQVGVLDMYKFHQFTIGHAWTSDFGDPEVEEDFRLLQQYSPLHNIRANTAYPPVLCCTSDTDDRVVPMHTLKYIASMQHTNPEAGPFLARVMLSSGHGYSATKKFIEESADRFAFMAKTLSATWTK